MKIPGLAASAAAAKGWPARQDSNGDLRLEIPTQAGRTQVVNVTMAKDGDGDAAAFVWSKCGEIKVARDWMTMLALNMTLTYGKVAVRGGDLLIVHALYDDGADLAGAGTPLYW